MKNDTDMTLFLAVVDHGSFSAAARVLGQTPSAVGKRIRMLEKRLGVELIKRTTRSMTLTEAGVRYAEELRDIVGRLAMLEEDLKAGADRLSGSIRMTAPTAFGQRFVVPAITAFMSAHPAVEIDLTLTDKVVDLVGDQMDWAVRTGKLQDSSLLVRRIGPYRRAICAAPDYVMAHTPPRLPSDLKDHRCLTLPHEKTLSSWGLAGPHGKSARFGPGFVCNSLDALARACLDGNGIACIPEFIAIEHIKAGRLVPILIDAKSQETPAEIALMRADSTITSRRVREFGDFLYARLRAIAAQG